MVAKSGSPTTVRSLIDGQFFKEVTVSMSDLYTLFESDEYKERTLDIEIPTANSRRLPSLSDKPCPNTS
jgi:hypothetical protein